MENDFEKRMADLVADYERRMQELVLQKDQERE